MEDLNMRRLMAAGLAFALITPALADDVELVTGEVLKGEVLTRSEAGVSLKHPILGKIWLSAESVKSIDGGAVVATPEQPPMEVPGEETEAAAATAPEVPDAERWKMKVELGANGKKGNGDSNDLRAAIEAKQEDDKGRWLFRSTWIYSEADDSDGDSQKTKDSVDLLGARDWKIKDSKWFYYGAVRHEWDEFQDWSRRLTASVGVGRELVQKENYRLRARAGYSTVNESGSDAESWRPEGLIGFDGEWDITENQSLEFNSYYFPDFDDSDKYRLTSRAQYKIKLTDFDNIAIAAGLDNEYDNHRTGEFDRNELNYYIALLYEF
jgi:hypothetical protein